MLAQWVYPLHGEQVQQLFLSLEAHVVFAVIMLPSSCIYTDFIPTVTKMVKSKILVPIAVEEIMIWVPVVNAAAFV